MREWTNGERRGTTLSGGVAVWGGPVQGIMGMGNLRAGEILGIHVSHASHEAATMQRAAGRARASLSTEAAVRGGVKLRQTADQEQASASGITPPLTGSVVAAACGKGR